MTEIQPTEKYKYWDVYDQIPHGWKLFPEGWGSPLSGTVWIYNGKNILNGRKQALLRVDIGKAEEREVSTETSPVETRIVPEPDPAEPVPFPAKSINKLARDRFKEQILKDIMFDLTVCEIEGWDKLEYIRDLKKLINSIGTSVSKKKELTLEIFR